MAAQITPADIEAIALVLDDVAESSDDLSPDAALALRDALAGLDKKIRTVRSLLDSRLLTVIKDSGGASNIGGRVLVAENKGKWRPNHSRIRGRVVQLAITREETGEIIDDAVVTAERAVALCYDLFVAPSDMPKVSGLEKLRLEKSDVADWEHTSTEIKEVNRADRP